MKYLQTYKLFEGLNNKTLSREEVINLLQTKCKKFLSDGYFDEESLIFRRDEDKGDFLLVDPKSSLSPRIAPNSGNNFHNLIISNLDSWKGWPRRNKSLICASSGRALTHSASFAKVATDYVVIPFDTTKIATGDRSDFWECFKKLPRRFMGENGRPMLPGYISSLMKDLGIMTNEFDKTPYTFVSKVIDTQGKEFSKEMIIPGKWITKINPEGADVDWEELKSVLENVKLSDPLINKYFKVRGRLMWDEGKNLLENLDSLLNPISNSFKLGDVTSTMKLYSQLDPDDENYTKSSLESWIEDECILIKYSLLDSILQEIEAYK